MRCGGCLKLYILMLSERGAPFTLHWIFSACLKNGRNAIGLSSFAEWWHYIIFQPSAYLQYVDTLLEILPLYPSSHVSYNMLIEPGYQVHYGHLHPGVCIWSRSDIEQYSEGYHNRHINRGHTQINLFRFIYKTKQKAPVFCRANILINSIQLI